MFKIGQKVVCKNASPVWLGFTPNGIKRNTIYTVDWVGKCDTCGSELIGIAESPRLNKWCSKCDTHLGFNNLFLSFRFEPLKYDLISNTEIIKEMILERLDVPEKEPAKVKEKIN